MKTNILKQIVSPADTILKQEEGNINEQTTIISKIAHELRTPLHAIIASSDLLLQERFLPEQRVYLDILRYSAHHALELANQFLDLARLQSGKADLKSQPMHLRSFLEAVTSPFWQQTNDHLTMITNFAEESDHWILADETRLKQILDNLLSNAFKFTSSGTISFTVTTASLAGEKLKILFTIQDTGMGIPEQSQSKIFDAFVQVSPPASKSSEGSGLGLAICRELINSMDGTIHVSSEQEKGSIFNVELIFQMIGTPEQTGKQQAILPSLHGLRILLVEDNPVNMMVARRFLQKWSCEVDEAVSGIHALDLFHSHHYDLLLIDLEMPGMDGRELAAFIRHQDTQIPLIAFTAAIFENMEQQLTELGFSGFIPKPFAPEDLHKKILQLTGFGQLQHIQIA